MRQRRAPRAPPRAPRRRQPARSGRSSEQARQQRDATRRDPDPRRAGAATRRPRRPAATHHHHPRPRAMTQAGRPWRLEGDDPRRRARAAAGAPELVVPVGTTEQHGPHLPLGCDTIIVEHLADDLSAEFGILRAPTVEYGVHAPTHAFPGGASLRRRTLHRVMNELIESWEEGAGVQRVRHPHRPGERGAPRGAEHHPDRQRHGPGDRRLQPRLRPAAGAPGRADPGRRARHLAAAASRARSWCTWSWPATSRSRRRCSAATGPGTAGGCPQGSPGSVGFPEPRVRPKGGAAV